MLPAVLTIIGFADLHGARHLRPADFLWLTVGALGSPLIGVALGAITRLGSRDGAPLLFTLGLNRPGQAAVIASRAMLAGIPFAPERDGRTSAAFGAAGRDRPARY